MYERNSLSPLLVTECGDASFLFSAMVVKQASGMLGGPFQHHILKIG